MGMKNKKKIMNIILGIVIVMIFIWFHLWKLASTLTVWNVDELGMGYDALCLKEYGTDRFSNSYPLYLTNYGGGQSVLYAYICSLVLHFVKFSKLAIRLPGFIGVCVSACFSYLCMTRMKEYAKAKAIIVLGLTAITPVYVMLFRVGMDCNLMLAVIPVFFFFLSKAIEEEKMVDYVLAGLFAGVVLYTYAMSYVIMVVFLVMMFLYLLWVKKINWKNMLAFVIPLVLLAFPLIWIQLINMFDLSEKHLGPFTLTKLSSYRASEISFRNIKPYTIKLCIQSMLYTDFNPYNSVAEYGVLYFVSIPFFMIGFICCLWKSLKAIKKREWELRVVFTSWFILLFTINCMLYTNVNRMNAIYVSEIVFVAEGIVAVVCLFQKKKLQILVASVIAILYFISGGLFVKFYFGSEYRDKYEPMEYCAYDLDKALETAEEKLVNKENSTLYIGDILECYMYYVESKGFSPEEFFKNQNGDDRTDYNAVFQNVRFSLPEEIDVNGVYIVDKKSSSYVEQLQNMGFTVIDVEYYDVCYTE